MAITEHEFEDVKKRVDRHSKIFDGDDKEGGIVADLRELKSSSKLSLTIMTGVLVTVIASWLTKDTHFAPQRATAAVIQGVAAAAAPMPTMGSYRADNPR